RPIGWERDRNGFRRDAVSGQLKLDRVAAAAAERVDPIDARVGGDREAIDVSLAAAGVDVVDAHRVLAVYRGGEAHEGIRPKRVAVLGDHAPLRVEDFEMGIERRAEPGGADLGTNRLALAEVERPDVDVLTGKDAAVDRHRQGDGDGNRVARGLLFDDFRQV